MRSILLVLFGLIVSSRAVLAQDVVPSPAPLVPPPALPPVGSPPLFPLIWGSGVPSPDPAWTFPSTYSPRNIVTPPPGAPVSDDLCPSWRKCGRKDDAAADQRTPTQSFWNYITLTPTYLLVGGLTADHPPLVFNDGTTYAVMDYWRVDDQLHFITLGDGGTRSEHTVPFADLDVQRTTDANTARGFRFIVRDEPIEQWLRDHPPLR
jgi:hypothetical protein